MHINPIQVSSQLKTGLTKAIKVVTEPPIIKETAIRTITDTDKGAFRAYVQALKYKTGIKPQEVNELFIKEGDEFLNGMIEFLFKNSKIPETIRPSLKFGKVLKDNAMEYDPVLHCITIGQEGLPSLTKAKAFGLLRHELQHARQNLDVLRHETIGKEAIDFFVKTAREREKQGFLNLVNIPDEKLVQMSFSEAEIQAIKGYKALYKKGETEFNNYLKQYEDNMRTAYERLRNETIEKLGLIKEGSKTSEKCKLYFDDWKNVDYYNPDGTFNDIYKYQMRITELEASLAGEMAEAEVMGQCYFKNIKNQIDYFQKNPDAAQNMKRGANENAARYERLA